MGVKYDIHGIRFDTDSFRGYAKKSLQIGQSLSSLHRAHRIAAIEKEMPYADTMILGTMGGEFIKGANNDDYIVSDFVYEFSQNQTRDVLNRYLILKNINAESVNTDYLIDFFKKQNWCKFPNLVDFYGLVEIAASLHHAQNNIQYQHYIENIFTPYLDIDYLELIFQSEYNFMVRKKFPANFQQRLENFHSASEMQNFLSPELAKYPYNSGFIPTEYKLNRIYTAIKSRMRKKLWNYKTNFPLGEWMNMFIKKELDSMKQKSGYISEVFELNKTYAFIKKFNNHLQRIFLVEIYHTNSNEIFVKVILSKICL